jgi:AraC-like DNA-binding protein
MQSTFYLPHEILQPYIQGFVYACVGNSRERKLQEFDLFPVGHSVMTFILDEHHHLVNTRMQKDNIARLNFTGQLDRYHHLVATPSSMVYVLFKPFGAYKIFGIPQILLKNECIALSDLLGNYINDFSAKLEDNANDPQSVVRILQEWIVCQLAQNSKTDVKRIATICAKINQDKGQTSINEINTICGISKSSMEQHFNDQIGLNPKMYSKIVRFNQINRDLKNGISNNWLDIVNRYGYFDQSHFIREFKHFFGYTPSQMHLSYQNIAEHITSFEG